MQPSTISVLVGIAVAAVVYVAMGLATWTVIHSGWSDGAISVYFVATYAAPLVAGMFAGWWVHNRRT